MKRIKLILLLTISCFSAFAQYPNAPIYGLAANTDTRFASLNITQVSIADTLGATPDTIQIIPGGMGALGGVAFEKTYFFTLKDSACLVISKTSASYTGSRMRVVISNGAVSGWVQFIGFSGLATQWKMPAGTTKISPTASHIWVGHFFCNGTAWVCDGVTQD